MQLYVYDSFDSVLCANSSTFFALPHFRTPNKLELFGPNWLIP